MDHKPFIDISIDSVHITVNFEHFKPARIEREKLKVRPGTTCLLKLGEVLFNGRSYVHPGDQYNGNLGMRHSLEDALHKATIGREHRKTIFAALDEKIAKGQAQPINVYAEV